jgi:hypothetical protein
VKRIFGRLAQHDHFRAAGGLSVAALVLVGALGWGGAPALPRAADDLTVAKRANGQQVPCASWWTDVQYRNYGYDHMVYIQNQCERAVACVVSTDVNPKPIAVHVEPGAIEAVVAYRGSPWQVFQAEVTCREES